MALIFNSITLLGWSVIAISVLIGVVLGNFIHKKFPNLFKHDRKMKKIIKNPHLLMEKLKAHGKIYDQGKYGERVEMGLKVELDKESGKEILVIERKENPNLAKIKERIARSKRVKKEISEKEIKPKKRVKKK